MTQHALLSASAAHRWLHCTAAPRLEATFPDTGSTYAAEGTLAHAIAELKLRRYAIEPMSQATYTRRHNKLKKHELYQPEMEEYTDEYLDYIKRWMLLYKTKPYVVAEKRLDFSAYVPEGFGTADCLIMTPYELYVIDFKYGKGVPVIAENNAQMRLYALGAMQAYGMLYPFTKVRMCIVQPRLSNISEDVMKPADLIAWGNDVVKPKADEAFSEASTFAVGDWCRFCRAKAQCKARSEHYSAMADVMETHQNPALVTMQELGQYLETAKELKSWAEDLQEYALSCCLKGEDVPGWKAVEGRGSRAFTDQDAAFAKLMEHGIDESILYNRVPLTLAQTEKAVGKSVFAELVGDYVEKKPGKPTLAPASDKRPAVTMQPKAADVFNTIGG